MKHIGVIHSPYKEKFSIPRQPGLTAIESTIELLSPYDRVEALLGLENFSHLWVIFEFHETSSTNESSLVVRPPRLGGNVKQGVFATRSPFRPNNVGLSLVEIVKIENTSIVIRGGDFLDKTPVLDLKPYLKEIECVVNARSGWTDEMETKRLEVVFDCECDEENIKKSIIDILSLDPRPAFHKEGHKTYGSRLFDVDVHWKVVNNIVIVFDIVK
jgi:tRNA-Thr(GGU) m(6)t(6)A37 methyltransferase TsaA